MFWVSYYILQASKQHLEFRLKKVPKWLRKTENTKGNSIVLTGNISFILIYMTYAIDNVGYSQLLVPKH